MVNLEAAARGGRISAARMTLEQRSERARRLPAAMAAGVVDTLWSFETLFDRVMGGNYTVAA